MVVDPVLYSRFISMGLLDILAVIPSLHLSFAQFFHSSRWNLTMSLAMFLHSNGVFASINSLTVSHLWNTGLLFPGWTVMNWSIERNLMGRVMRLFPSLPWESHNRPQCDKAGFDNLIDRMKPVYWFDLHMQGLFYMISSWRHLMMSTSF